MRRTPAVAALLLAAIAPAAGATALAVTVAAPDGRPLADVVAVLDASDGHADAGPPPTAAIDQVHKQFVPRVSVIRTGTLVNFPNSDRIRHQVYSFSKAKTFNLKLYAGTAAPPVVFDHAGVVVLGCNIHDSMVGFVAVVDSPYFGRSDGDGRIRIEAPPGRYRLRLWHPQLLAPVPARAVILSGEAQSLNVEATLGGDLATVAPLVD